jgi:hypothetical protein
MIGHPWRQMQGIDLAGAGFILAQCLEEFS